MRILCLADVVGSAGRKAVRAVVPGLARERGVDFVVANGENIAGGLGATGPTAAELFESGVHVLTGGNHTWKLKEVVPFLEREPRLLRPYNYPPGAPGRGVGVFDTPQGPVAVVSLLCRVFMDPIDCPFRGIDRALEEIAGRARIVIVDVHGEATSEKRALGWHIDGRATVVFGSHTHVPTADEEILPGGTAYVTDIGMTGPYRSIIGMKKDKVLQKFLTRRPVSFETADEDVQVRAVLVECDAATGRASSIERIRVSM